MADDLTRREFVKLGVAGAAALAVAPSLGAAAPPMPERPLGRTGHNKTAAARLLGVTFRSLRYRMERLGME